MQAEHIDPAGCLTREIDRRLDRITATHQKKRLLQRWRQDLPETFMQFEPVDIEEGLGRVADRAQAALHRRDIARMVVPERRRHLARPEI